MSMESNENDELQSIENEQHGEADEQLDRNEPMETIDGTNNGNRNESLSIEMLDVAELMDVGSPNT